MKFEFKFPDIGEGIHEGVITKWLVEEGAAIKEGESVAEVETDKVTTEIPSPKSGTVLKLLANKGDTINVGQVFVTIETGASVGTIEAVESEGAAPDENALPIEEKLEVVEEETAGVVGEVIASSELIPSSTEGMEKKQEEKVTAKVLATPVARQLAKDLGVNINSVKGTGPNGRVMKEDINNASMRKPKIEETVAPLKNKESSAVQATAQSGERSERIPLTRIRKTISERMTQSRFTIPHTTAMDEVDISKLYELRKKYKDELKAEDINLTYLPFIIKATLAALKELPEFNASLDMEKDELILKKYYDIGIAADTERGLMVPVVREADRLSIIQLAKAVETVSAKAKNNTIELSELKGSTFTITNYGSIGGYFGIPIINYPESGVLGLGRVTKKPIVRDDEIVIAYVLPLSLSYDHRIIDGASGAKFLNIVKELLSNPELLLLKS
jgi:pyruvate dehydrogenase E2 component (dihydrolipoamide acetyltransferase)